MESVMNFLADYYIWFFVAALVLCFALIGFIIESKKKQKNEFKGEEVTESAPMSSVTEVPEDVTVVGNTVDMEGTTSVEEARKDLELSETPVMEEPVNNNYDFYSSNVDMPVVEEAPTSYMNDVAYDSTPTETLFEEEVNETPVMDSNILNFENDNIATQEEKVEELNIFDDIK